MENKYVEQYKRVQRWFKRFKEINNGRLHDRDTDFYEDDMYAFFMNCYHLKDWIKNDPTSESLANKVEGFINNTPSLKLCADICNGLKHLRRNRPTRSEENLRFGPRLFKVGVGTRPTTIAIEYVVETSSGPIKAFDIAEECLNVWRQFLEIE